MIRKKPLVLCLATLAVGLSPCLGFGFDVAATKAAAETEADKDAPQLFALYKDIHQHPELGYQEKRTAALLAKEMRALGFAVTEGVGKTGIVAIYKNGAGPTVMVRTDIDALPIEEETGLPYASRVRQIARSGRESFVSHACGHDTHMATWVGTAKALLAMKDRWHGTLMFIGQPAEEGGNGAKAMIDDGLFVRFPRPDYAFGLHNAPDAFGIYYRPGIASSSVDDFQIVFHGRSSHGSRPNMGIDPVLMAARFAVDVQAVISREKDPAAFGVIAVGSIDSGPLGNGTPDKATVRGATRAQDAEVREKLLAGILRTAKAEADMAGAPAPPDVDVRRGYSMIVNDAALTEKTAAVFRTAFGADVHERPQPMTGSEDFSEYGMAGVPSFYFEIGAYDPQRLAEAKQKGEVLPVLHSPKYVPAAQAVIRTGTQAMTLAVVNAMQAK
ncbi:MAG: amidohydrolase [Rudaea sp.]|uniref:amidohydrolase n=1 Tax=Rudaea sp. TaxID=2136325 RepID=UPI0039E5BCD9